VPSAGGLGTGFGMGTFGPYYADEYEVNGGGTASLSRYVGPGAVGRIHVQGIDQSTCGLSNELSL